MIRCLLIAAALPFVLSVTAHAEPAAGRLVIAGGALERETETVWQALLENMPDDGRIAVIPGASGEAASAVASMEETLALYGIPSDRVDGVHLAMIDDSSTPDVDESQWSDNAGSLEEIAKISKASVIWFTGGDQARLTDLLLTQTGDDTPMLAAIRQRLASGATVGGSSAGAAIMSCDMIARGDTLPALRLPVMRGEWRTERPESGALVMERGLCFFKAGLADQHFDRQARLGRLVRALSQTGMAGIPGFGIDENTALIVDLASETARIEGASSVVVLATASAVFKGGKKQNFAATGLSVSVMTAGDRIDLKDLQITPADFKKKIEAGSEYNDAAPRSGVGLAVPPATLEDDLGNELVDNRRGDRLERISFGQDKHGVRFVFRRTQASSGAWGRGQAGSGRYTIIDVDLAIEPVRIKVSRSFP